MNIKDYTLKVVYDLGGVEKTVHGNDDVLTFTDAGDKTHVLLTVSAKKPVKIKLAELIYDHYFESQEWFFANGYQSWTTSREYKIGDRQYGLRFPCNTTKFTRKLAGLTGDYNFTEYGKDLFHSHTYTYLRHGDKCELFGTLNDKSGYTIFYADVREHVFAIEKDVEGVTIVGDYELFNVTQHVGTYDEVFDAYFAEYPEKHTGRVNHFSGYTSWYNYFQNITEDIILRDLEGLYEKVGSEANIFQIDDGYESYVGDWLEVDPVKFPGGMAHIADEIHKKGYKAGIWLAPFSAQFKSKVATEHPDWLIKEKNGKPLVGGLSWGGFYVLDIEKEEVREYIRKVFNTVFDEWGYDMVKLDFLYSVAILPAYNKSRGQLMFEAMEFLRECCKDKIILGCGVPLGASFGKVDACRISCDVELSFKEKFFVDLTCQEILSARHAMNNTIFRRHLNGRIFANDPDVFFLRDDGMKPAKFTMEQKKLLAKINNMFGSVLFVSDNAGAYDEEKVEILKKSYKKFEGKVLGAEYVDDDNIQIVYVENGKKYKFAYNLVTGINTTEVVK